MLRLFIMLILILLIILEIIFFQVPLLVVGIALLFIIGVKKLLNKRINTFFTVNRVSKKIHQSIKFSFYIKLFMNENYNSGRYSEVLRKEISKSMYEFVKYIKITKYKFLKAATNEYIGKQLERLDKWEVIKLEITKDVGIQKQIIEKLFVFGGKTLIKIIVARNTGVLLKEMNI